MFNNKLDKKHVYIFMGTTAEFIKLAPVIKEFKKRKIKFKIITSGQNKVNFEDLAGYLGLIKADIALKEKSPKSSLFLFFIWTIKTLFGGLISLYPEFKGLNKKNSYFIVHGDTISSTIGSLIGKIYRLKLVHIESGLRSFNFFEPFPEEICRFINMHLADILFCPNEWSVNNIKHLAGTKVNTKQNTLIETFLWAKNTYRDLSFIKKFKNYYILYIRRQEHIYFQKEWTKKIIATIVENADKSLNCLFTINILNAELVPSGKVTKIPKLPYVDFMKLMMNAQFIATDGCTNQEEAYYMGIPLLSLRNLTERQEGLGENIVISKGNMNIIKDFLKNYNKYKRRPVVVEQQPSKIIVDYLF